MRRENEVAVVALDARYRKLEKDLKKDAEKILLSLKKSKTAVEIYLVGNAKIRQLNRRYRGKDKATNILAFPPPQNFPQVKPHFLGEVYLCPPYIKEEKGDIRRLLTHGILHLLGFNHERVNDRMIMEKVEEAIAVFIRERSERT